MRTNLWIKSRTMKLLPQLVLILFVLACNDEEPAVEIPSVIAEDEIVRIPVVIHVLYEREEFNVSEEKINSQLASLNQDFRKRNADHLKTPDEFINLVADVGIEFELATLDPKGNKTTGITRTKTMISGWDGIDGTKEKSVEELALYFSEQGGMNAWPSDQYLNIWVTELSDRHGRLGLAGHSSLPGDDPRMDGVIIDPRTFGTIDPLEPDHRLGRTATHEIGHWLNLRHIFADEKCESTDLVEDTPGTSTRYLGNPVHPQYSCGQMSMFMNFMDYVNDQSMYMFTKGQRERMRAVFAPGGSRERLYQNIRTKK